MRKFPRSRAHIFGYLSITCHPYHLRAWNRLPPIPQFLFQTWPCGTSIVCLNLLSVLTFVRMKFLSLFVERKSVASLKTFVRPFYHFLSRTRRLKTSGASLASIALSNHLMVSATQYNF